MFTENELNMLYDLVNTEIHDRVNERTTGMPLTDEDQKIHQDEMNVLQKLNIKLLKAIPVYDIADNYTLERRK